MALRVCLLLLALLTGCGGPTRPDAVAPAAITRTETVDVPVAAPRVVPPELLAPLRLEQPQVLPVGQGEYGLTVEGAVRLLRLVSAYRSHYQLCRAYAGGDTEQAPAPGEAPSPSGDVHP